MVKIIFIFLITILLTGCGKYEKTDMISRGGRIQIALHSALGEIFPFAITDFTMKQISEYMLTPSLFKYDSQGREEPGDPGHCCRIRVNRRRWQAVYTLNIVFPCLHRQAFLE